MILPFLKQPPTLPTPPFLKKSELPIFWKISKTQLPPSLFKGEGSNSGDIQVYRYLKCQITPTDCRLNK